MLVNSYSNPLQYLEYAQFNISIIHIDTIQYNIVLKHTQKYGTSVVSASVVV